MLEKTETEEISPETAQEARVRLKANYIALAGPTADIAWFNANVEPIVAIATQQSGTPLAIPRSFLESSYMGFKNVTLNRQQWINYYESYRLEIEAVA